MACSLNSRTSLPMMSGGRKPTRVAPPRPPPPIVSPQRQDHQTPPSASLRESPVSLPRYEDAAHSGGRRGSADEAYPRRRPKPSMRRQSTRRSTRRRQRPEITIISSRPMSQDPAFADGAKGSHIPPEAPPSYDEAVKSSPGNIPNVESSASLPGSPPSLYDRIQPVESIEHDQEELVTESSETEPKVFFCVETPTSSFAQRVPPRVTSRNSNQNNRENRSQPTEQTGPLVAYFSSSGTSPSSNSQSVYIVEGERTPVPTPRVRRRVSTTRCTLNEFLTNTTEENQPSTSNATRPSVRPKPKIPPKKPNLVAHNTTVTASNPNNHPYTNVDHIGHNCLSQSDEFLTQSTNITMSISSPSSTKNVLSLFEDTQPGNGALPSPLHSRKLPPPPRPTVAPRRPRQLAKDAPTTNLLDFANDGAYATITQTMQQDPLIDIPNSSNPVPSTPVEDLLEEFGYASVDKKQPISEEQTSISNNNTSDAPPINEFSFDSSATDDLLTKGESEQVVEPVYAKVNKPISPVKPAIRPKPRSILLKNDTLASSIASSEEALLQISEPPPIPPCLPENEVTEETVFTEDVEEESSVNDLLDFGFETQPKSPLTPVTQSQNSPIGFVETQQQIPPVPTPKTRSNSAKRPIAPPPPPPPKAAPRKSVKRRSTPVKDESLQSDANDKQELTDVPLKPVTAQSRWGTASKTPPAKPKQPPQLPGTQPIGKSPKDQANSHAVVVKREKGSNSSSKGLQLIRRKSLQLKEKSMKIFKPRTSVDGMEKDMYHIDHKTAGPSESTGLLAVTETQEPPKVTASPTSQERRKPAHPPPPRPSMPAVLLNKTKSHQHEAGNGAEETDHLTSHEPEKSETEQPISVISQPPVNKPRIKPARPAPAKPRPPSLTHKNEPVARPSSLSGTDDSSSDAPQSINSPFSPTKRVPPPKPSRPKIAAKTTTTSSPAPSPDDSENKSILEIAASKSDKEKKVQIDTGMKQCITGEMYYVAIMDYTPTNFIDLSFSAGEKITVAKRLDGDLLFGRNEDGEEGPFPEKYVKLESDSDNENNSNSVALNNQYNTNQNSNQIIDVDKVIDMWSVKGEETSLPSPFQAAPGWKVKPKVLSSNSVTVLYDFSSQNDNELTVKAGEKVELLSKSNNEWVKAKCKGKTGILPVSFVDYDCSKLPMEPAIINSSVPSRNSTYHKTRNPLTGTALYSFTGQDDTELSFEKNDIINIHGMVNEEWLKGSLNGKTGIFPHNFISMA